MAKTFKNITPPDATASSKRASERDFFDLTEDPRPAKVEEMSPTIEPILSETEKEKINHASNTDDIGNTRNIGKPSITRGAKKTGRNRTGKNTGNTGNTRNSSNIVNNDIGDDITSRSTTAERPVSSGRDVRQTFVVSQDQLEKLRDHVHARKAGGDYNYSQKQALQEALDLLFASSAPLLPRPEQVRELEQQRREQIQQGRLARG